MRAFVVIFFLFFATVAAAQVPNSWVQYNQPYYKISVSATGVYRLTYSQLQEAGVPVASMDPRLIQVFHRGQEQALYFKHDQAPADANFDSGEYLEFYGKKNDGTRDAQLYQPSSLQPHPYYNLYSDTSAYFLTVNPAFVQGKRMELFDQVNSAPALLKETYQTSESLLVNSQEYCAGVVIDKVVMQSFFDEGEGWTGQTICTVNAGCVEQRDYQIDQLGDGITTQPPPTLEVQLMGRDEVPHFAEIYTGQNIGSLRLVGTSSFSNYQTSVVTTPINWTDIASDGKMIVRVRATGVGGIRDRLSVNYIKVNFAQGFNVNSVTSKTLRLNAAALGSRSYIELSNTVANTRIWDITNTNEIIRIGTRTSGALLTAVVGNTSVPRTLYLSSDFIVPEVSQIKKVVFREMNTEANYLIVSHRSLMKPGLSYSNPVEAYAAYRAGDAGGGYDTLTVPIDQLYDQFNYGETSPTAVFEFMRYMIANGDPQYLFLIGKGRDVTARMYRRAVPANEAHDLVPTAGNPGSDMAFTAGMDGDPFVPAVATGRLTATTPAQVAAYLNKVKEAEAQPFDDLWRKRILHLSGGIQANELPLFRSYMQGFAEIAKGDYLGGEVSTLGKHGVSTIEFINVSKEVNAGVNLVTFFGHSSSNSTDIDIGYVSDQVLGYNNPGRYPAFLVNGCNAGEFFNNGVNFGEDWIMTPGKGARNFIANSSFGFDLGLRLYTTYFYEIGFADSLFLSRGIGDVQKETARRFLRDYGNQKSSYTAQVQHMMLLGDPSLSLFGASKPDFETSDVAISVESFDGKAIHALTDSLQLKVIVKNLGRATKRTMQVKIEHGMGEIDNVYIEKFPSVLLRDTLKYTLRRGSGNFFGNNTFKVTIDPNNIIEENNEDNNVASLTRFFQFNGTQNLQPADFGIVTSTSFTALFQDTDILAVEKTYDVQIDTVPSFNSAFLKSTQVKGKRLLRTDFTVLNEDSTVYYWRTKPADKPADQWETTSFSYIKNGPNGWAQLSFDQMTANGFAGLVPDTERKKLSYEKTSVSIFVKTFGTTNTTPGISPSFQVNNAEYFYSPQNFNCRTNTINLVAFDKSTVVPYLAIPFTFQNAAGRSCGREPQLINSFTAPETDTGNSDDIIQYVNNMKAGDSVVLFTLGDAGFASWTSTVKTKLEELGIRSSDIDGFIAGEPVIILGRKGAAPGTARIIRSDQSPPQQQELQLTEDLTGYASTGTMTSVVIGPASKWKSLTRSLGAIDASDEIFIDVYGISMSGAETVLYQHIQLPLDLNEVDAAEYPYLRLVHTTTDFDLQTPAPVRNWIVGYDPVPDGILMFNGSAQPVELNEGLSYAADFSFVNISGVDFNSQLATRFSITNQKSGASEVQTFDIAGPAAGGTTTFSRTVNTLGKRGLNNLSVVVNTGMVVEQYYSNNAGELPGHLNVLKDAIGPVLEVTFDGRYLSDGDYVSANPTIRLRLRDENVLLRVDTTMLNFLVTRPCSTANCQSKRVNFSSPDVTWMINEQHELVVEYKPKNLAAGEYQFFAEGKDASGNPSGPEPYHTTFVVDNQESVNFYPPYPNPSRVGFFFDFAVAGSAQPESYVLNILNRDGRDVAEFSSDAGPSLRVGMNQLWWSGLDVGGNKLAAGVYFYQMKVKTAEGEFKYSGRLAIF